MQFNEEVQVETLEPEPEPVFIDEVTRHPGSRHWSIWQHLYFEAGIFFPSMNELKSFICFTETFFVFPSGENGPATADDSECRPHG